MPQLIVSYFFLHFFSCHSQLRKVFSVQGPYPVIRAALWARGWVERRLPHPVQKTPTYPCVEEEDGNDGLICSYFTGKAKKRKDCPPLSVGIINRE